MNNEARKASEEGTQEGAPASGMSHSLCESDRARIEWCVATVRGIADLGRSQPLGDHYPQAVMVIDALKTVLKPTNTSSWIPAEEPPRMAPHRVGWLASEPVLVFCSDNQMRLATFEHVDEDYPPVWYSKCSERWDLTKYVTHWMPLPAPPAR